MSYNVRNDVSKSILDDQSSSLNTERDVFDLITINSNMSLYIHYGTKFVYDLFMIIYDIYGKMCIALLGTVVPGVLRPELATHVCLYRKHLKDFACPAWLCLLSTFEGKTG